MKGKDVPGRVVSCAMVGPLFSTVQLVGVSMQPSSQGPTSSSTGVCGRQRVVGAGGGPSSTKPLRFTVGPALAPTGRGLAVEEPGPEVVPAGDVTILVPDRVVASLPWPSLAQPPSARKMTTT